ncbi:T7SS effector LXG polymorphic toxin [Metabacillus niabensis]|uniref:T7SS effector LXG polymorphic toxin n=1 Tax=Metabacillus niabensis TaxID=324854 RepID=UPI001CFA9060|nr:T7SS effector LXG polymorphic toxin [Metabacillus niabensis]
MKVLETKTLIETMEDRAKVYTDFRDKIDTLKKEFTDITQLDDALQGKGADAIKGFYQAQIDVADGLLRLVDMQIAFLNGVSGAIADIDLSGDTVVDVNFLETDLSIHASNHIAMVESQREDLQKIIDGIDDIVNLEAFSADDFNTAMDDAKKKRENTIKDVDALDQQLLEEYKVSESAEFHVGALFQQLLEATAQGNTISPINFDAQAYKASEAYQLSDEVQQYADDYLSFKEDQEKIREELKKAEELENRPIYEKAWDTVKTFTGEATGYYDFLRAKDGVDPVTGEELTDGQRVAAGAMATAGFIPVVGWGGRLFKGGSAIYKTAKGMNTAEQALTVYKTTSTFSNLQKAELGIYGLASANGLSEYITGKDMFGNELTDVQRQSSLFNSILGASLVASPFVPALVKNGKLVKEETLNKMHRLATNTKASARYVYDEVRGGMQVLFGNQNMNFAYAGADGVKPLLSNVMNSKEIKKRIEEVASRFSFGKNFGGSKGSEGVVTKVTGNVNLKNIEEFIDGTKSFDDVVDDFARLYSEKIQTNKTWSWNKSFHGGEYLTARQRKLIKEKAIEDGLIPKVNVNKADGMRYGFADFKSAGLVVETKDLPERLWLKSDEEQFEWLDDVIGGRPEGMTWHHTEVPGKMELVPFGIHNITIHNGGRSTGMWADAPR